MTPKPRPAGKAKRSEGPPFSLLEVKLSLRVNEQRARLDAIAAIVEEVDARVLATDGAIDPGDFGREIDDDQARAIYVLARGTPARECGRLVKKWLPKEGKKWLIACLSGSFPMSDWLLSSSSAPEALAVVDGTGRFAGLGPHYSRRTPGSKTFTGVGQEVVLVTDDGAAVWACVRQRTPSARGTGGSRGRTGVADAKPRYIWRNMLFRNLGTALSSDLIRSALARTYMEWDRRYGGLPEERLRTEIDTRAVRSRNPGYCYKVAGWIPDRVVRGKLYLFAPERGAWERTG